VVLAAKDEAVKDVAVRRHRPFSSPSCYPKQLRLFTCV
jgi:hypothetical protein